jgi:hypothetical protein
MVGGADEGVSEFGLDFQHGFDAIEVKVRSLGSLRHRLDNDLEGRKFTFLWAIAVQIQEQIL